jgi:hypothetical protein
VSATTPQRRIAVLARLPWRSRSSGAGGETAPPPPAGTLPCTQRGCAERTGSACGYQDRRDRACPTAWCPEHRQVVEGRVYCRRHAGIAEVVAATAALPPDIENRAVSLARWVGRELDPTIQAILERRQDGSSLVVDAIHPVSVGFIRVRAWEWSWKLVGRNGIDAGVAIRVEEPRDDEVIVTVGSTVIARVTPSWIECRRLGVAVTPAEDASMRGDFYRTVVTLVLRALRQLDERALAELVRL